MNEPFQKAIDSLSKEILGAFVSQNGAGREFAYNGKHQLTTRKFVEELKLKHPKLARIKHNTLIAAINKIVRTEHGHARRSEKAGKQMQTQVQALPLETLHMQVTVPTNCMRLFIQTKDPATRVTMIVEQEAHVRILSGVYAGDAGAGSG